MITLDSANPPIGIWYIKLEEKTDFMACLQSNPENPQHFNLDFRFRYYRDEKVFTSEDVRSWYHIIDTLSANENEAIRKVRAVVLRLCEMQSHDTPEDAPQMTELLYRDYRDFQDFLQAFQNQPFYHGKMASPEEIQKFGLKTVSQS